MVRGVVSLPHGTGKQVRVLALCTPDKEAEATALELTMLDWTSILIRLKAVGLTLMLSSLCLLSWVRSVLSWSRIRPSWFDA